MASINDKLIASAVAILSLAGDLYESGSFEESHVEELFSVSAYGGLSTLQTVANQIVQRFTRIEGYSDADADIEDIYKWAYEFEKNLGRGFTVATIVTEDRKCYYCGKKGHVQYSRSGNGEKKRTCPAQLAGEEPCGSYKKYLKDKFDIDWTPRNVKDDDEQEHNPPPSCAFEEKTNLDTTDPAPMDPSDNVSTATIPTGSTWRERSVATTGDIKIMGSEGWIDNLDVLTDTDGCENIMDFDFAKNELKL